MPLPAGYALNEFGWVFETTTGNGYGPYGMNDIGFVFSLGSGISFAASPIGYKKGLRGLWYKISDNSGPFAVTATTVRGIVTSF